MTISELLCSLIDQYKHQVEGREILALSDTSKINLQSHAGRLKAEGLGVVGNNRYVGFFIHPTIILSASLLTMYAANTQVYTPSPTLPLQSTYCTQENGYCSLTGTEQVLHGAGDKYAIETLIGRTPCANAVFGDPIVNTAKSCEIGTHFSSQINITKGGTYTGNWQSTIIGYSAVTVNTAEPVIIKDCHIESVADAIRITVANANVTVKNCYAKALTPSKAGVQKGSFVGAYNSLKLVVQNNTAEGFSAGTYDVHYGDGLSLKNHQADISYNKFTNIDGRFADGAGGYTTDYNPEKLAGAVYLQGLASTTANVSWNQVINTPFQSAGEDQITTRGSGGMITVNNNYVQGSYPPDPSANISYTGSLLNIGDNNITDTGGVTAKNNTLVSFDNTALELTCGHNNEVAYNTIVSAQKTQSGTLLGGIRRVPLIFWNLCNGSNWHDNNMHDNKYSAVNKNGGQDPNYTPSIGGSNVFTNNINPFPSLATSSDELKAFNAWNTALKNSGKKVGCSINPSC